MRKSNLRSYPLLVPCLLAAGCLVFLHLSLKNSSSCGRTQRSLRATEFSSQDVTTANVTGEPLRVVEDKRVKQTLGPGRNPTGPCTFALARKEDGDNPRVVVSISSMLGRVEYVMDTVKSVFEQSYGKPDMVYLSVPKAIKRLAGDVPDEQNFVLPENVTAMVQQYAPYLKLLHPPDYGAATKLLGAVPEESDPETIIVTLDDDVTYHQDTIACLVGSLKQLPPTFTVCNVCEEFDKISRGWRNYADRPGACVGWLAAYAGAAYRRGYIANDWASDPIFNLTGQPHGCWVHDDVWLSGHMYRKGIRPYQVSRHFWTVAHHRPYNKFSINRVKDVQGIQRECIDLFDGFVLGTGK